MSELMLALFVQARGAFAQLIVIYMVLCTVPLGLGVCLLFAPRRAGNFLSDAFAIFPHVEPKSWLKKMFYRVIGLGFIGVSAFYTHQIYWNLVSPISHFFRSSR
jgi:hypothetical protein